MLLLQGFQSPSFKKKIKLIRKAQMKCSLSLVKKNEASKTTDLEPGNTLSDDEISPLDKLNFCLPRQEIHSLTTHLPI